MEVAWLPEAPGPITVIEQLPTGVEDAVAMVKVELPFFFNDAASTEIYALSLRHALPIFTVCAEPLTRAVLMVVVAPCPSIALRVLGLALIEKSSDTGALTA